MFLGGCYRNPVHYFSFVDTKRLIFVLTLSWSLAFILLIGLVDRETSLLFWPLGLLCLGWFLAFPRIFAKIKCEKEHWSNVQAEHYSHLLIYGAGKRGQALAKWTQYGTKCLKMKGFIDDDPDLRSKRVFGYYIYGRESDIPTVVAVHDITEIWVSFLPDEKKREMLKLICAQCAIKLVIIPEIEPFSR
jgi:FlaA1/EpsC-like NDP-sugar epimerase